MRERQRTLPPKLRKVTEAIDDAIAEAKKIREVAIQEEVVSLLTNCTHALEDAKKAIARIMRL